MLYKSPRTEISIHPTHPIQPTILLIDHKHMYPDVSEMENNLPIPTMQWHKNYLFRKSFCRKKNKDENKDKDKDKDKEWKRPNMSYIFGKQRMQGYQR